MNKEELDAGVLEFIEHDSTSLEDIDEFLFTIHKAVIEKRVGKFSITDKIDKLESLEKIIESESGDKVKRASQDAGYLLEEIVNDIFSHLTDVTVKSYRGPDQQYDLMVTSSNEYLNSYMSKIVPGAHGFNIIVEAKFEKTAISTSQFKRLCSILTHSVTDKFHVGIFFSKNPASGFKPTQDNLRVQAVRDCRFTQIVFNLKTNKFVIVFDLAAIKKITSVQALLDLIHKAIDEVGELTGLQLDDLFEDRFLVPERWTSVSAPSPNP